MEITILSHTYSFGWQRANNDYEEWHKRHSRHIDVSSMGGDSEDGYEDEEEAVLLSRKDLEYLVMAAGLQMKKGNDLADDGACDEDGSNEDNNEPAFLLDWPVEISLGWHSTSVLHTTTLREMVQAARLKPSFSLSSAAPVGGDDNLDPHCEDEVDYIASTYLFDARQEMTFHARFVDGPELTVLRL